MRKARPALLATWAAVVVAVYFRRAWTLLLAGPGAWSWPDFGLDSGSPALPFLRDALARGVRGVTAAAIVIAAAWTVGAVVRRVLGVPSRAGLERIAVDASLGVGGLGVLLLGLASVGLYTSALVTPFVSALAVVGIAARALTWRSVAASRRVQHRALPIWSWVTLAAIGMAFICALAPESEYDALWYHLELPRRWLAAGHPVDDVTEYVSLYPLHWELLYGAALPIGGTVGARLIHWTMLGACSTVAAVWSRRLEAPPWLAAAVFASAPTVLWEGTTAYADLALALHVGVAGWALARTFDAQRASLSAGAESPAHGRRRETTTWRLVAGLAFGFACATKHLGLVALASAACVYVIAASRARVRASHIVVTVAVVGVLACAVATPWYAWSEVRSGNPVFPELYRVFGASPAERWSPDSEEALQRFKDHFGIQRTPLGLLSLPWHFTMHGTAYGGTFGPLGLAALPALLLVVRRRPEALALLAAVTLYGLVWASPLGSFQARFLVPAWIVASPLLALTLARAVRGSRAVATTMVVLLVVNLPPFIPLHEGDRVGWQGWLTHVARQVPLGVVVGAVSEDEYLRRHVRSYAAWRWIETHVPRGDTVLTFSGGDQFYTRHPRLWTDAEAARAITWWARSPAGAIAALQDRGIRWVLAPEPRIRSAQEDRLPLVRGVEAGALTLVYRDTWYALYRLEADSLARVSTAQR